MHGSSDRKAAKAAEKRAYRRLIDGGGCIFDASAHPRHQRAG